MNFDDAQKIIQEYGARNMLTCDLFKEYPVSLNDMNKILCSQWLSDNQIVFGTKCNKLMVYNVVTKNLDQISLLHRPRPNSSNAAVPDLPHSVHSVQINPSRTLLSTGARNSNDIAIYRLPNLDPVFMGEGGHSDLIFDTCWVNDEFLVSGSRDNKMSLWHVDDNLADSVDDQVDIPTHKFIQPVCVKQCQSAEKVRALALNKAHKEIAAISLNGFIHIWSADTFEQKTSRKLSTRENVCLALQDDKIYAVGCLSGTLLLDARTLQTINKIPSRDGSCGIRTASFQGSLLTIGGGYGMLMFYDVRAQKYLESSINSNGAVTLRASKGYVFPDQDYIDDLQIVRYMPAIFTHCYDASGTQLFAAGGPLPADLYGNYAGLWQ